MNIKNLIILLLFLICMLSLKSFSQCPYEIDIELVVTQPVSCPNGNDGIVTATLLVTNFGFNNHFSAPRGIFINPGSSSTDLMFLTKGYITVNYYVTDPFDNTILCQGFDSIFVGNLLLEDSIRPTTCLGGNDGAVTVNSLNGTPPFQYTWNTSSTNQEITGLTFGRYTCHVTDALGCDSYITSNIVIDSTSSISGIVFADLDSNKSFSPNDFYLAKQMLMLLPDSVLAITDDSGYYHFNFHSNCDNEIVMLNNPLWHVTTDSLTYHVHTNGSALTGFDFGLAPIQQKDSVICTIIGGRPRCSWYIKYYLEVTNVGTTTILNNILHFTNASNLQFDTCDVPYDSTSNSNYFWQIDSLRPFQSMQIQVTDFNLMGGNIPLNFALAVELQSGTVLAADSLEQVTLCSYDPNDKSVVPEGIDSAHYTLIDSELKYLIRFQNTGNDTAIHVLVVDTLDPALDLNSFQLLSSSHSCEVHLNYLSRVLSFDFNNIMLPDSNVNEPTSHGYVLFEIRPKTFLSNQTVASNSASIFFDLNSPVQTNTVFNTLVYLLPTTINEVTDDDCLRIFPTIVDDKIFVLNNCNQRMKEFSIYNGLGQLMKKEEHHSGNSDNYIDVTKLPNGFYILMMKDVFSNSICKKFIKN